jgi:DNA helicase-2/ATP-dependent DNA helicase PcrA
MSFIEGLNKEQRAAVEKVDGPVIVFAGAGTGKTRTLTTRIAYMITEKDIDPKNILAITFTKKATNEMRERVIKLSGINAKYVTISTIHAFCARILRQTISKLGYSLNFEIVDEEDVNKIINDIYKDLDISKKYFSPKAAANIISAYKNGIGEINGIIKQVYDAYQKRLKENNQVDFDDLLVLTEQIFTSFPDVLEHFQNKYKYILVDEFQDTNVIQYNIIKLLADKYRNIFVVGDDDQSIYSFRGANVLNMYQFSKDYPDREMIKLTQNYRSTNAILRGSNNLIKHNKHREEKELFSDVEGKLQDVTIHDSYYYEDEPRYIADEIKHLVAHQNYQYKDIAILYRTNVISRNIELGLIEAGIPYQIYGGFAFLKRKEIKDVLSYLKFIMEPENLFHFKRIINLPARGIGDKTIEKLMLYKREDETLFEAITRYHNDFPSTKTEALVEFKDLIVKLQELFEKLPLPEFYDEMIELTHYKEALKNEDDDDNNRILNIEEFKSVLVQLERRADLEGMTNKEKLQIGFDDVILDETVGTKQDMNGVVLSTVHSIKGLEFRAVFVVALEEGIFPSLKEDSDIEEERRIAYVAFTRAKERIYITCVSRRLIYGRVVLNQKSRFITEYVASLEWKEHLDEQKEIEDNTPIKVGDKVTHCNFGDGLVISESGSIIQVLFDKDHSFRKILRDHPSIKKRK